MPLPLVIFTNVSGDGWFHNLLLRIADDYECSGDRDTGTILKYLLERCIFCQVAGEGMFSVCKLHSRPH